MPCWRERFNNSMAFLLHWQCICCWWLSHRHQQCPCTKYYLDNKNEHTSSFNNRVSPFYPPAYRSSAHGWIGRDWSGRECACEKVQSMALLGTPHIFLLDQPKCARLMVDCLNAGMHPHTKPKSCDGACMHLLSYRTQASNDTLIVQLTSSQLVRSVFN